MAALIHVDLMVRDLDVSLAFYAHLGCTVADDTVLHGAVPAFYSEGRATSMRLVLLDLPGARAFAPRLELMQLQPAGEPLPSSRAPALRNFAIAVADLDVELARLAEIGVAPASDVMDVDLPRLGKVRIAFVRDPDGNLIELVDSRRGAR